MTEHDYLEQLPHAAVEIRESAVVDMNTAARNQLPQLVQGAPVPAFLARSLERGDGAGSFQRGEDTFLFTRVSRGEEELILFRPAERCGVTGGQLEGFSRQIREQMATMANQMQTLADEGEDTGRMSGLNQNFHKMLRLINNLEFLNVPEEEAMALFRPVTMDLAGLCIQLVRQAAPMLRKGNVELSYASQCAGLLIPGDPELLQRMLLGLVSNAAKAAPGGSVTMDLRLWRDRAVVTISDSGGDQGGDLADLLKSGGEQDIPVPGEGAGMGLDVVRRVVRLHQGAIFTQRSGKGGLSFTVSLPTGPLPVQLPLHSPSLETDGGFSPFLVELADVLPTELFQIDTD